MHLLFTHHNFTGVHHKIYGMELVLIAHISDRNLNFLSVYSHYWMFAGEIDVAYTGVLLNKLTFKCIIKYLDTYSMLKNVLHYTKNSYNYKSVVSLGSV